MLGLKGAWIVGLMKILVRNLGYGRWVGLLVVVLLK